MAENSYLSMEAGAHSRLSRKNVKPTFIDLFAGCGGLSLGMCQSGWNGLFGVELRADAFSTYKANFLNGTRLSIKWPRWLEPHAWNIDSLLKKHEPRLRKLRGCVDLVCGGPPCQGFSYSGKRNRDDPRNRLVLRHIEFVELVAPIFVLLENVPGFSVEHGKKARSQRVGSQKGRPAISGAQRLRDRLSKSYIIDDCLVCASKFGVPQIRNRYFAVGVRKDTGFSAEPGWAADLIQNMRREFLDLHHLGNRPVTAREAIWDLETTRRQGSIVDYAPDATCNSPTGFTQIEYKPSKKQNCFIRIMRHGMNGQAPNSLRIARHTPQVKERFQFILKEYPRGRRLNDEERSHLGVKKQRIVPLDPEAPAHTLTTLPDDLLHYKEPRILTAREYARLQSFPDWFEFHGKYTTGGPRRSVECPRYTQIGNAVPPLVAEAWGYALRGLLDNL